MIPDQTKAHNPRLANVRLATPLPQGLAALGSRRKKKIVKKSDHRQLSGRILRCSPEGKIESIVFGRGCRHGLIRVESGRPIVATPF